MPAPMHIGMQQGMNPLKPAGYQFLSLELAYTIIIVLLCLLVFFKTREFYLLTKHKGIKYFRYTFLFFGLAYAARFLFHILHIWQFAFSFGMQRRMLSPYLLLIVGYLSTMALFYLTYSLVWKKIKFEHFITFANLAAVLLALVTLTSRSPGLLAILQLALLLATIIISILTHKTEKKISPIRGLYILIVILWFLNLLILTPGRLVPLGLRLFLQTASIIVFIIIIYRISKKAK